MSKVYVFNAHGGPENQELIDRPMPTPGPGELLIEVRAAGVNPFDVKIRTGVFGADGAVPMPMGQEASGVVRAVGPAAAGFAVGNDVLGTVVEGQGAFAEHTLMRADVAIIKPEEISFADAATIPVAAATAYDGTHQIELEAGQKLLILGAGGGVGLMAAQIGRVHEFDVIGVDYDSKRKIVESTGATFVNAGPGMADRVRAITPAGVDLILDLVGGEPLRAAAGLVRDPDRIISTVDPATATELGGNPIKRTKTAVEKITDVIKYKLVDPHVLAVYPLARAGEAIAAVEAGNAGGKVVIEM